MSLPRSIVLPHLQTIEIHQRDQHDQYKCKRWSLDHGDAVFFHPRLKRLSLSGATLSHLSCALEPLNLEGQGGLEDLHLSECDFAPNQLRHLLTLPKNLKRLFFRAPHIESFFTTPQPGPRPYMNALSVLKNTLVTLVLDLWLADWENCKAPLDFSGFRSLQHLTLTSGYPEGFPEVLTGDDYFPWSMEQYLPRGLVSLKFIRMNATNAMWRESQWRETIRRGTMQGSLPSFRELIFEYDGTYPAGNIPGAFKEMEAKIDGLGITGVDVRREVVPGYE